MTSFVVKGVKCDMYFIFILQKKTNTATKLIFRFFLSQENSCL